MGVVSGLWHGHHAEESRAEKARHTASILPFYPQRNPSPTTQNLPKFLAKTFALNTLGGICGGGGRLHFLPLMVVIMENPRFTHTPSQGE